MMDQFIVLIETTENELFIVKNNIYDPSVTVDKENWCIKLCEHKKTFFSICSSI